MDTDREVLEETLRLTRDTNRVLHSMRRSAMWWGIVKFIIYAALLTAPVWFYMTYLNEAVQKMLRSFDQLNSSGAQVSAQMGGFEQAFKEFEAKLPAFMQPPSSSGQ